MYLQQNPNASYKEVKDAIIVCSKQDNFTGPVANPKWGYGKVDAYSALSCNLVYGCTDPTAFNFDPNANADDGNCIPVVYGCMNFFASNYNPFANTPDGSCTYTGIKELNGYQAALVNYPNPFINKTVIHYKFNIQQFQTAEIIIENLLGENIETIPIDDSQNYIQLSNENMDKGVYFYSLVVDGQTLKTSKLIVL